MLAQENATVLRIDVGLDPRTERKRFQVYFGSEIEVTKEISERIDPKGERSLPYSIAVPIFELSFSSSDKVIPYRIGSEWKMEIDDAGGISIKEVKKNEPKR